MMADDKKLEQEEYWTMPLLTREELEEATSKKIRTPEETAKREERRKRWAAELEERKKARNLFNEGSDHDHSSIGKHR